MQSRYRWGPIGNKGSHRLSTLLPFSWRYTVKPPTEPTGPTENTEQGYSPSGDDTDEFIHIFDTGTSFTGLSAFLPAAKGTSLHYLPAHDPETSSLDWEELQFAALISSTSGADWGQRSASDEQLHYVGLRALPVTAAACCGQHVGRIVKVLLWRSWSTIDFTIGNIRQNRDRERYIPATDWFFFLLRSYKKNSACMSPH